MPDQETFEEYKEMQTEIENNIMTRLHPTLQGLLNGQAQLNVSMTKIEKKVDLMFTAYTMAEKVGSFAAWVGKNVYKIIITLGALGIAIAGIRDGQIWEVIKRIFGK